MIRFSLRGRRRRQPVGRSCRGKRALARGAFEYDEARSDAASQWTTLLAMADVLAERGRLDAAAELLGATEGWPAAPYLRALAARARERVAIARRAAGARARARSRGAKALARAEL